MRANAALNGVTIDARLGDCYAPVAGERFDLICTNPPQMPTPPGRERRDAAAAADNGGRDGWELLDRVIAGAPASPASRRPAGLHHLRVSRPEDRGREGSRRPASRPRSSGSEIQSFPRIGYERLEHIRAVDLEATVPSGIPETVERFVIQGTAPR